MNHRYRQRLAAAIILAVTFSLTALGAGKAKRQSDASAVGQAIPYKTVPYDQASPEKMKWWEDAKFGLFVHWGVYSVPGGVWSRDNTLRKSNGHAKFTEDIELAHHG